MTVRGQVISEKGEPLHSASITLVNNKGEYLGEGVKSDNTGKFGLTSAFLNQNYLLVTYAGMEPLMIDPEAFTGTNYKAIQLFPKLLDPVYVHPEKDTAGWWWLLAIPAAYALFRSKKKRRKAVQRKSANRKPGKRKTAKRKTVKRKSVKRKRKK
jgi:hypothetical protein